MALEMDSQDSFDYSVSPKDVDAGVPPKKKMKQGLRLLCCCH